MNEYVPEEFLGQIFHDGRWMDYARGTEASSKRWVEGELRAGRRARVVHWIDKQKILFGEGAEK